MRDPRISPDLVDWLKKNFPPLCIHEGQTEVSAHRYAGKVELAQRLIKMGQRDEAYDISIDTE
ncbi:hypothetical protein H7H48_15890 [Nitratireductor sp. B36]|uniref:hypothetical protein n=1 Tax=Nitratireductor sp. B36 TaxID=2762059 RepID=UPI001E45A85A|nr:hypothetical protein [Nitratireductor sp. B36]MCC5780543.1 hypothetical protein [Nitratireductor sp. B36]